MRAVVGIADAQLVHCGFHRRLTVNAAYTALHIRRGGAVVTFHCHRLGHAQLFDRLEKGVGVDVQTEPRFLAQENDQSVARVEKVVFAAQIGIGQAVAVGHAGAVGVVGARHLERVAQLGDFGAHSADAAGLELFDEVAGQAARDFAAVGPLAPPAGDEVAGIRGGLQVKQFVSHRPTLLIVNDYVNYTPFARRPAPAQISRRRAGGGMGAGAKSGQAGSARY